MNIVDMHCDTLTEIEQYGTSLDSRHHFSLSRLPGRGGWLQFFAIFMPDELRGPEAIAYFDRLHACYRRQLEQFGDRVAEARTHGDIEAIWDSGRCAAILSVEGGSALAGQMERVAELAGHGVRMLTLTWNGQNEIGGGQAMDTGLTDFGRAVIPELERCGIILDLSHLGDQAFWQAAEQIKRPPVASHSNSRTICPHGRNLTDRQFRWIAEQGGLVGLCFCPDFMGGDKGNPSREILACHLRHFLRLGGEDAIALGSDFDGTDVPDDLNSPEKAAAFCIELMDMGLTPTQVEKLMYKNAMDFLARYGF